TRDLEGGTEGVGQATRDRKADAEPLMAAAGRSVGLTERLEEPCLQVRGDPFAGILDTNLQSVAARLGGAQASRCRDGRSTAGETGPKAHLATRRELRGVGQQVRHQRLQQPAVDRYPFDAARQIDDQAHPFLLQLGLDAADQIGEEVGKVYARAARLDHSDLGFRKAEDTLDEVEDLLARMAGAIDQVALLVAQPAAEVL